MKDVRSASRFFFLFLRVDVQLLSTICGGRLFPRVVAFAPFVRGHSVVFTWSLLVPVFCSSDPSVCSAVPQTVSITVALCKASLSPSRIEVALLGLSPLFISEICQPARCLSPQVLQGVDTTFQMGRWCNRDPHTRAESVWLARGEHPLSKLLGCSVMLNPQVLPPYQC